MPPPSSENDLKRHARRRLIGAVALSLLAVIVLPLLLEDEPPPASPLAVRMAAAPETLPEQPEQAATPDAADATPLPEPEADSSSGPIAEPEPKADSKVEPAKAEASKPAPKPQPSTPVAAPPAPPKPVAASEAFVVQLAALSDPAKADVLKGRAVLAGLPAYTDKLGDLTRVRVGPFSSREAAETAVKKLADSGLPTGRVVAK
ncbi:MAG: SPOR domain-containing protein [Thiobacillus sp.]